MDEARRIAYKIAKLPAFLADLDPHQRTIRAPCTKIKGVAFVRFRRPSLNLKNVGQLRGRKTFLSTLCV
jgi:hypothetical protein